MGSLYKLFILAGAFLILAGLIIFVSQKFNIPLGRLPGDIIIKKENFSFYFPITTCILASIVLTIFFYLFRR